MEIINYTSIACSNKILPKYPYLICCKLKLNLHGNNKLHIYWTCFNKILLKYPYLISCKLKLNLHGNNKLHIYWTYSKKYYLNIFTWYVVN